MLSGFDKNDGGSYRYGYVRPIEFQISAYEGRTTNFYLWTIDDDKRSLIVARIDNAYIPLPEERAWAEKKFKDNGWLATMKSDLRKANISPSNLTRAYANIRFRQQDVTLFDPPIDFTGTAVSIATNARYNAYHCTEADRKILEQEYENSQNPEHDPTRQGGRRARKGVSETVVDLLHIKLQNMLYKTLKAKHGAKAVKYEMDFVDLAIRLKTHVTFIEIKIDRSAKRCIRQALGQVLEYSCYANKNRANELLVVGEHAPTEMDKTYLQHLREQHKLPIYYAQFLWDKKDLDQKY